VRNKCLAIALLVAAVVGITSSSVIANHSWGKFHWARTSNPLTLQIGDNVSGGWDTYLDEAISDWSVSAVLDLSKVAGRAGSNCSPVEGRIETCNGAYGENGWLGIASIWTRGPHILAATTKVNDTYFNQEKYNTPAWHRLVMCQEIAHDFGLDHQDENFNNPNLGTCMDYTSDPDGPPSNEHPNQHDYDQLESSYSHVDKTTTVKQGAANAAAAGQIARGQFGRLVRSTNQGRTELYVVEYDNGDRVWTHVIWAQ
jgi:hypothetical protein